MKYLRCASVILLLMLLACPLGAVADRVTVRYLSPPGHEGAPWLSDVIAQYERAHPGVTVQVDQMTNYDWAGQLMVWMAGGTAPDVFPMWGDRQLQMAKDGALLDLRRFIDPKDKDDIIPQAWSANTVSVGDRAGTIYGIPTKMSVSGFFYNKDLFEEAGVSYPQPAWTWSDLRAMARKLARFDGDGTTQRWGMSTYSHSMTWLGQWVWQAGGDLFDPQDPTVFVGDSTQALEGLSFLHNLVFRDRLVPPANVATGGFQLFLDNRLALWNGSTDQVADVADSAAFEWAVIRNAAGPGGKHTAFVVVDSYSVWSGSKYPKEATDLALTLASAQVQSHVVQQQKRPSPRRTLARDYAKVVRNLGLEELQAMMEDVHADPRIFYTNPLALQAQLEVPLKEAFTENKDIVATMKAIAPAVRAVQRQGK